MVKVQDVTFKYREENVIKNINLELSKGDFCAIIGPNGSGKTTLLKLLSGELKLQSGTINFNKKSISDYSVLELSKQISVVSQRYEPVYHFTVFEMVMFGRNPHQAKWGSFSKEDEEIVMAALKKTNLISLKDRMTSELSGGEFQRTLIARAIAQQAPIMLLDEPLANLDIPHQYEILEILSELNQNNSTTILLIIHDISVAMQFIPKAILLKKGEILHFSSTAEILKEKLIFNLFDLDDNYHINEYGNIRKIN